MESLRMILLMIDNDDGSGVGAARRNVARRTTASPAATLVYSVDSQCRIAVGV